MGDLETVLDPANIFGTRPGPYGTGKFDIRGALDPGGTIIEELTGSEVGFKIADPKGWYQPKKHLMPKKEVKKPIVKPIEEPEEDIFEKKTQDIRREKLRRKAMRTILTTPKGLKRY